ncbi:hypothetical protein ACGFZA_36225 [Streptomyces sp. NPDC048211]|uniref:hypothetical protein n=1 Tax=Streptomyces sp. NPDC048211 TaxID=3365516 RepID=UPI000A5BC8F4
MTATATIDEVVCLRPATSTDFDLASVVNGLLQPVYQLPGAELIHQVSGIGDVGQMIQDALDEAPDDLYATSVPDSGVDHAVWPPGASTVEAGAGNRLPVGVTLPVEGSQDIFLWDRDDVSSDDLLGSITISEAEQGQGALSKLAHSEEEKSYYYVNYHVD